MSVNSKKGERVTQRQVPSKTSGLRARQDFTQDTEQKKSKVPSRYGLTPRYRRLCHKLAVSACRARGLAEVRGLPLELSVT